MVTVQMRVEAEPKRRMRTVMRRQEERQQEEDNIKEGKKGYGMIGVRWTSRKKRKRRKRGKKKAGRLYGVEKRKKIWTSQTKKKRKLIQNILLCYNS